MVETRLKAMGREFVRFEELSVELSVATWEFEAICAEFCHRIRSHALFKRGADHARSASRQLSQYRT